MTGATTDSLHVAIHTWMQQVWNSFIIRDIFLYKGPLISLVWTQMLTNCARLKRWFVARVMCAQAQSAKRCGNISFRVGWTRTDLRYRDVTLVILSAAGEKNGNGKLCCQKKHNPINLCISARLCNCALEWNCWTRPSDPVLAWKQRRVPSFCLLWSAAQLEGGGCIACRLV